MTKPDDRTAFTGLIQTNKGIIFKICHTYCRNKQDTEDLAQEIIYRLWKSFHHYDPSLKFTTWMYKVALNVAISFYRKDKMSRHTFGLSEDVLQIEDNKDSSTELEEKSWLLQSFIQKFKELDRALILLYLEDKSYKEIADILGITETNVATKINRVKEKLRQKFTIINK